MASAKGVLLSHQMTHRKIKDATGKPWDVWEVYPSAVEERMSGEYPAVPNIDGSPGEKRDVRIRLPPALQSGWLAFQAGNDRRRLAPIPTNWISLDNDELIRLLGLADRLLKDDSS